MLLSTKTAKKEEVKCVLRKGNVSTRNAEKDGALNTISRLQKAKNRSTPSPCKLRSQNKKFEISQDCIFCCQPAHCDGRRRGYDVFPVKTAAFETTIRQICGERKDEWSQDVLGRLSYANDLCAKKAVYHQQCSVNFRTGRDIPKQFNGAETEKRQKLENSQADLQEKHEAFLLVAKYCEENSDEQVTVIELTKTMEEYLEQTGSKQKAYGVQYMKKKLEEHFGNRIIFTNLEGKANVMTWKTSASSILYDYFKLPKSDDEEEEARRIIQTAAKLIKSSIKALNHFPEYPGVQDLTTENTIGFLPGSLKLLLQVLFAGQNTEKKQASLGHAIIQAARPRGIIAPLQLGLAIQMHHHFGSKFLVDSLHQHGFCCSYVEVQKFLRSASVATLDIAPLSGIQLVQFAADNVDHNVRTLDGHGTFHGMGMVAAITPCQEISRVVPRKLVTPDEIIKQGRVKISQYNYPKVQQPLNYDNLSVLKATIPSGEPKILTDILWKVSPFVKWPRPAWSGLMQMVHKGIHPGKAAVVFLPMIDLDPSDMTCIYSTLLFLSDQARKQHVTPVITFDQPLWWKAWTIITNEPQDSHLKSVVLRIGGLHTEMSYLGCIGRRMENSGLSEALEVVYGSNAVTHMLSRKALARARRGHFLVDAALNLILIADALQVPLPNVSMPQTERLEVDLEEDQDSEHEVEEELSESVKCLQHSKPDVELSTVDTLDSSAAPGSCTDNVSSTDSSSLLQKTREALDKLLFDGSINEVKGYIRGC